MDLLGDERVKNMIDLILIDVRCKRSKKKSKNVDVLRRVRDASAF